MKKAIVHNIAAQLRLNTFKNMTMAVSCCLWLLAKQVRVFKDKQLFPYKSDIWAVFKVLRYYCLPRHVWAHSVVLPDIYHPLKGVSL